VPVLPTQADVAAVIPQRTGDVNGVVTETFGATTVPTDAQVTNIIAKIAGEVTAEVGAVSAALEDFWRWVVTLGAAAQTEQSFWPDQENHADDLWARFRENLERLRKAAAGGGASASAAETLPVFGYPPIDGINPITTLKTRF
jgi:hypothetical protein